MEGKDKVRINLRECLGEMSGLEIRGREELDITGVAYDSRMVRDGNIFFALPGASDDGAGYVDEAVSRGAAAVVARDNVSVPGGVSVVRVDKPRRAMARLASVFFGAPSGDLRVTGITGTNGKTTTAYLLCAVLEAGGRRCGLIGSVEYRLGERAIPARLTTPQSSDIQSMLREMVGSGCRCAVMEVSSHGLHQGRTDCVDFDAAIFTNLASDHLDYHGSMDNYREAKLGLFRSLPAVPGAFAVINGDDPAAPAFMESAGCGKLTYGVGGGNDVRAVGMVPAERGSEFLAETPWGSFKVAINLPGLHNVYNALAALAAGLCLGTEAEAAVSGLGSVRSVPGRFEPVECGQPFHVIVDYAHTEDGLRKVMETARAVFGGRVLLVFGCGGDRDRSKRPGMGRVASDLADVAIITSDNPRGEDPLAIIEEIRSGFKGGEYEVVPDRREAVARTLELAGEGDAVLIAGKGHESYQEFADFVVPFNDREVAQRILAEMGYKQ